MTLPPCEPSETPWHFPPVEEWDDGDLIAVGADLEPGTLLAGYRRGMFPMPIEGGLGWFSPMERGVLELAELKVSRSLRKAARGFEIRVDTAFDQVVAGCADPRRPQGWIDNDFKLAYSRLHRLGWAHSVEAWQDGVLAGGLYGVAIGGIFAGESMFHRARDASKVALLGLVEALRDEYAEERLIDVQWLTPHLASLGVRGIPRAAYLERLRALAGTPHATFT